MPFESWQEAIEELKRSDAPPSGEQLALADALGIELPPELPQPVAAAVLREAAAPPLWTKASPQATDEQQQYVRDLASELERDVDDELTTRECVRAWLQVLFADRAIRALEELKPLPGDVVEDKQREGELGIVSSISADGRINYEGGLGAGARPNRLRTVARAGDASSKAVELRRQAANALERRRDAVIEQTPSGAKMNRLVPWLVKGASTPTDAALFEEELEKAIDERPLQRFLEAHPEVLASLLGGTYGNAVVPRIDLGGKLEPDFLFVEADSAGLHWWLIELESPTAQVLMADGELAEKARHAIKQIEDWRRWLTNNLDLARRPREQDGLNLVDIRPEHTRGLVLIGRRQSVMGLPEDPRQREVVQSRILVRTYDWLLQRIRQGPAPGFLAHLPADFAREERAATGLPPEDSDFLLG